MPLAVLLMQRQLYGYCPTWALDWEHRKDKLLQEIVQCGADIICLQEVETSQFHAYFAPELRANGYEGVFHPKTRVRAGAKCDNTASWQLYSVSLLSLPSSLAI
jgi:CCR4-NOT transcription complex subunit 6